MHSVKASNIKQDINFLEYPLWFLDVRHDGKGFVWKDREGYEYRSGYTPPDKVDILILLYLLHKSQQENYKERIICTKYEILKACDLSINSFYYARLKESLKRWANVTIHFQGTFYDGGNYESIIFHIMNEKVDREGKQIIIRLDSDWLLKIKESQYFKYINFELYKALKRPVSKRLHEWLCKNFMGRDKCYIGLTKLGRNLPIQGRQTRRGTVIYASDVLIAIKPAINEINRLSRDPDIIKKTGIKPRNLFTITYEITGKKQDRVIIFQRHPVNTEKPALQKATPQLQTLLEMLKKRTRKLERVVSEYYRKNGFEYVKWSILYANKKTKKSYSSHLQQTLKNNWAEEWFEEEKEKVELEAERREEAERKSEEERRQALEQIQAEKEKPLYLQEIAKLNQEAKKKLWKQAEEKVAKDHFNRESMIKVEYHGLLWKYLNSQGISFCIGIAKDFRLGFSLDKPF